ncbi:MAG: hypothetical protein ACM3QZ_02920 [Solirubrobacterales bacterium]
MNNFVGSGFESEITGKSGLEIAGILLSDGRQLSIEEAIELRDREHITGMHIGVDVHNRRYLRLRPGNVDDESWEAQCLI